MITTLKPVTGVATMDEVAQHTINTINRHLKKKKARVVGFAWQLTRQPVSNSHYSPLNEVRNWGRDSELPSDYPGWSGRVWIRYSKPLNGFGSAPFDSTLTYPGTGGWGSYDGPWDSICRAHYKRYRLLKKAEKNMYPEPQCYSWDYRFFLSDFPDLEQALAVQDHQDAAEDAFKVIAGQTVSRSRMRHEFKWNDPDVLAADTEFLKTALESTT